MPIMAPTLGIHIARLIQDANIGNGAILRQSPFRYIGWRFSVATIDLYERSCHIQCNMVVCVGSERGGLCARICRPPRL